VGKTTLLAVVAGAVLGIGILAAVTVTVISEDDGGGRRMVLQVGPGPGLWMAPAPPRTVQPPDFGPLPAPPGCLRSITIGPRRIWIVPAPGEKRPGPCRMQLPPRFRQR
jgi:hypothetical protein